MQLTQFSDYSLRAMIYLAVHQDQLCTITEIAKWYNLSKNHIVKIIHQLAKLGYVKSTQGKGGGVMLNKKPEEINIGQLVQDMEPHFHLVECFSPEKDRCRISAECALKHMLFQATDVFLKELEKYSLKDICDQPNLQTLMTKA